MAQLPQPASVLGAGKGGAELRISSRIVPADAPHGGEESGSLCCVAAAGPQAAWELPARCVLAAEATAKGKEGLLRVHAVTFPGEKVPPPSPSYGSTESTVAAERKQLLEGELGPERPADRGVRGSGAWYPAAQRVTKAVRLETPALAEEWAAAINLWAHPTVRTLYCVVNPHSGSGKGRRVWSDIVEPLLRITPHRVVAHVSNGPEDIVRYLAELAELPQGAIVAAVGGDGTMSEAVNGLMQRSDAERGRFTICFVPAGSANAMAHMTGAGDALTAAWALAKGRSRPLDLYAFHQSSRVRYGFLSITEALIADIDIDSEGCRCCGAARFTAYAVAKMFLCCCCGCIAPTHARITYPCRIRWLPVGAPPAAAPPPSHSGQTRRYDPESGDGWREWEGELQFFQVMAAPALDQAMRVAPDKRLDDGHLQLQWMRPKSRCALIGEFDRMEASEHLDGEGWDHHRVAAVSVDRLAPTSKVVIDGEQTVPGGDWYAETLPQFVRVVVGSGVLPAFSEHIPRLG
eukprot:TRINITY_DN2628_c0_g1_i1.p1 TRINITY_DN2628_c0_g1~~TRINITY_DN2628_c0_g1_i1.p1  ORF type:complete len:548 (+),score=174.48 TRINITY_DN2628_c0_g1_i1:90-1646(+)